MDDKKIDEIARDLEKELEPLADEIAQAAVKKIEPVTRIITLVGFAVASIFFILPLVRGSYEERAVRLLFWRTEAPMVLYIVAATFLIITLWHLFSTIRFFINRSRKNKGE